MKDTINSILEQAESARCWDSLDAMLRLKAISAICRTYLKFEFSPALAFIWITADDEKFELAYRLRSVVQVCNDYLNSLPK